MAGHLSMSRLLACHSCRANNPTKVAPRVLPLAGIVRPRVYRIYYYTPNNRNLEGSSQQQHKKKLADQPMATAKLIIESLEWKASFNLQLPNNSTLQDLKSSIADTISSPPDSLHLSLDKKHELISSLVTPLTSLGITPSTPIYYTRYPNKLLIRFCQPPLVTKLSFPSFTSVLQRVYNDRDDSNDDYVLMMIAVHVMLLSCGFVSFDTVTSKRIQTLKYTTTRLVTESNGDDRLFRTVNLKFEAMGKNLVSVHRFLSWGNHGAFVWLDVARFVPSLKFVCANSNGDELLLHQRGVFEMWNIVKDGLKLGLVVDHFDKMRLGAPSFFMCLPPELRVRILEFLPGNDIAKVGCVCAELSHLSLEDDLWKKKCMEEFPLINSKELLRHQCKYKFAVAWKQKRNSIAMAL